MDIFEDPISFEIMEEAVISKSCGHSFSNKSITAWLQAQRVCPICKTEITISDLSPNFKLREAIEHHLQLLKTGQLSPPEQDPTIVELLNHNETEATQIYARAFLHDPWMDYFLGKNHNEFDSLLWFCGQIVRYAIQYGRVWGKIGKVNGQKKILGVAIWQPPNDQGISIFKMLQQGCAIAPFKLGLTPSFKVLSSLTATERVHRETITEPHWYLFSVGVESAFQNNGIGTKIMYPVLQLADKSGLSCYLDTSNKRSISFFVRLGFEVVREIKAEGDSPQWWAMLRKPMIIT
jgi:ribosomal protein S18 acetylase RimI-like enzyme